MAKKSGNSPHSLPTSLQKGSQNVTQEVKGLLQDITESSPVGVLCFNEKAELIFANPTANPILAELGLHHKVEPRAAWKKRIQITLRTGRTRIYEVDVKEFHFKVTMKRSEDQKHVHLYCNDITVEKTVESVIQQQRSRAQHAAKMATLGEMAGGVAHEINNPLAIIKASTEVLVELTQQEKMEPESAQRIANGIEKAVHRIAKIVASLRYFAREADDDPFEITSVRNMIEDTLSLCRERFCQTKISLETPEVPEHLLIECRPVQVSQVLVILLNNAYDKLKDTEGEKWAKLEVDETQNEVIFSVIDSGHPVPTEIREKLFQPFYSTKDRGMGTGMGLSVGQGIAHSHKGKLVYDPKCSTAKFVLQIPKRQLQKKQNSEKPPSKAA